MTTEERRAQEETSGRNPETSKARLPDNGHNGNGADAPTSRRQSSPIAPVPSVRPKRPFDANAMTIYASPALRSTLGQGALCWKYTILVPVDQTDAGRVRQVAPIDDIDDLRRMLADHFGGVTGTLTNPALRGVGPRDPKNPETSREENGLTVIWVYAAAVLASEMYFRALQKELAAAWSEGVVLIERTEVLLP